MCVHEIMCMCVISRKTYSTKREAGAHSNILCDSCCSESHLEFKRGQTQIRGNALCVT